MRLLQATTAAQWVEFRERRDAKRLVRNRVAAVTGFLVMQIALLLQFSVGAFRNASFAEQAVNTLLVLLVLTIGGLLIVPDRTMKVIEKVLTPFGHGISTVLTCILLGLTYLVFLPAGALSGRKTFMKRHPGGVAWAGRSTAYRDLSTWVPKQSLGSATKSRSMLFTALNFFFRQKNWLLLVFAVVLLLLASIIMFANSPVVAPFIYPLF